MSKVQGPKSVFGQLNRPIPQSKVQSLITVICSVPVPADQHNSTNQDRPWTLDFGHWTACLLLHFRNDRISKLSSVRSAAYITCADFAFFEHIKHRVFDFIRSLALAKMTQHQYA
jgi:hypothetical protein